MSDPEIRALIIDDSPTDQKTLAHLLGEAFNCQVETASDGPDGLTRLSQRRFAVVFLDMVLPSMDGVAVLREIRGRSETAHVPVVIISGSGDPATVKSVLGMGVQDYILKPYNKERVITRLAKVFKRLKAEVKKGPAGHAPEEKTAPVRSGPIEGDLELKAQELIKDYGQPFFVELIDVFLEEASSRVARLREAVEKADQDSWIRETHTLKSGCANIGASALADLAKEMELSGRAGKMEKAAAYMERFEALFGQVRSALEMLRAGAAENVEHRGAEASTPDR